MKEKKVGIYKIRNIIDNKFYVGSSIDLDGRKYRHFHTLKIQKHANDKLQRAYNKYGKENFVFEIIERLYDLPKDKLKCKKIVLNREQYWIDKLDAVNKGYNINKKADSRLGTKQPKEAIESARQKNMGRKMSEYNKQQLLKAHIGMKHSKESKAKMSKSHKGCKPWNKGVPRTEKEKENISKGHIGIKISEETRRKLSDRNKGENNSFYGKRHSEKTKKILSEKHKGLYVGEKSMRARKVLCVETGEIFGCIKDASIIKQTNRGSISAVCKGKRNTAGGYHWKYVG